MAQKNAADDRDGATESKFYLPAGATPQDDARWVERLWATLFDHRV